MQVVVLAWDRSVRGEACNTGLPFVAEWRTVHLPAPTWSARLIFVLPALYRLLCREIGTLSDVSMIVVTHFFLLPLLLRIHHRVVKIYDAAEMYSFDVSLYFGHFSVIARPFLYLLEGVALLSVDGITTVDSRRGWLVRHYRRWCRNAQAIWNVPAVSDAPDLERATTFATEFRDRQVIAFVGGLMREKGLRVALEATALVRKTNPQVLLLLIGPLKDDPVEIEKMIRCLTLQDIVINIGPKPYDVMMSYLAICTVGLALHQKGRIYSRVSGGNGRKFFTYMQAGLPIVGPNFGEVGIAVKSAGCGVLVDTESPEAVAAAVTALLDDPSKAKELGEAGRRKIDEVWNWEMEKKKFFSVIDAAFFNKRI
ncbi:glycosyltransferase [Thiovibrio sp. JS02]